MTTVRRRRSKSAGKQRPQRFLAWSYSRLRDYEQCPARAKYRHLDKLDEGEKGRALLRGIAVHESAEGYLNAKPAIPLAPELELFTDDFKMLRRKRATPESGFQFDADWQPLDDWFDPTVWCRVKTDAEYTTGRGAKRILTIIDFKTGRQHKWHGEQLELYGLAGLLKYPEIQIVDTELWYTDDGGVIGPEEPYTQGDVEPLKERWTKRAAPMLADTEFQPTPSMSACQWCPFKKAKGGPCEY